MIWVDQFASSDEVYVFSRMKYCSPEDLQGGEIETNKEIAQSILDGNTGPKLDIVILNSAAAILTAGAAKDFNEAIDKARESITSGSAKDKLTKLIKYTNG